MKEIQYELVKEVAVLSASDSGYTKEINLISWNGREPKYDMADMAMLCVPHTALKRGTCSMPSLPISTDLRIWLSMMKRR